ncbi:MAG: uracil-DNA glycosylase [Pseudomonadota bacterium]|nr:uracil-DNA glycosylase [Pseudomonadota bacterium]
MSETVPLNPRDALRWYLAIGVDESIATDPVNWTALAAAAPSVQPARTEGEVMAKRKTAPVAAPPAELPPMAASARDRARQAGTLEDLRQALADFDGCALKKTATNLVFADGIPGAPVMLVGEAPGEDEDRQGKPFVGVSGQLLDRMLACVGLSRQSNVYITNVLPWRPPGNRQPTETEIAACLPFLQRHIELVKPAVVMVLGGTAAKSLLGRAEGITRIRGRWMDYDLGDGQSVPLLPTYHPAYLLRTPAQKRMAWRDLLALKKRLSDQGLLS